MLDVLSELARGCSLYRALFHRALRDVRIAGEVLDLGAKSRSALYYRHLRVADDTRIRFSDLNGGPDVVALDVTQRFPFPDASLDVVLAFNLFEHVFDTHAPPREIARILRPAGRAVIAVPFLHEYHADPEDHFRFTLPALERIWGAAGFAVVRAQVLGQGPATWGATKLAQLLLPRGLARIASPIAYLLARPIDALLSLRRPIGGLTVRERFALGYLVEFGKRG